MFLAMSVILENVKMLKFVSLRPVLATEMFLNALSAAGLSVSFIMLVT